MKLRAFQKWPQNSSSFLILGDRAFFSIHNFSSFAILEAAKKETFFHRKVVTVSPGKGRPRGRSLSTCRKGYFFPYFFLKIIKRIETFHMFRGQKIPKMASKLDNIK